MTYVDSRLITTPDTLSVILQSGPSSKARHSNTEDTEDRMSIDGESHDHLPNHFVAGEDHTSNFGKLSKSGDRGTKRASSSKNNMPSTPTTSKDKAPCAPSSSKAKPTTIPVKVNRSSTRSSSKAKQTNRGVAADRSVQNRGKRASSRVFLEAYEVAEVSSDEVDSNAQTPRREESQVRTTRQIRDETEPVQRKVDKGKAKETSNDVDEEMFSNSGSENEGTALRISSKALKKTIDERIEKKLEQSRQQYDAKNKLKLAGGKARSKRNMKEMAEKEKGRDNGMEKKGFQVSCH